MKKKFAIIFFSFIAFYFAGVYFISQDIDNNFSKFVKDNTPWQVKNILKKTIFSIPLIKRENEKLVTQNIELNKKISSLQNEYDLLFNKSNLGKRVRLEIKNFLSDAFIPPYIDYSYDFQTKNGYLELYKNLLIIVNGKGNIYTIEKKSFDNDKVTFNFIKSNLPKLLNFRKDVKWTGVKDVKIVEDQIFMSVTSEITENCFSTSLVKSKINMSYLEFEYLFKNDDCTNSEKQVKAFPYFNGYQTGGRIVNIDKKLYLTIGDYNDWEAPQMDNKLIGKLISIDIISGNIKVISKGHRNPQGLSVYSTDKKILISTEHGPKGGDEINMIYVDNSLEKNNFGWPLVSYGDHYDVIPINSYTKKFAPLKKNHEDYGFQEPIFYFNEGIGISEIVKKNNSEQDQYFITSLKEKSIYIFDLDKNNKQMKLLEKIEIGERIRDIIFDKKNNEYYLYLESTPLVAKISFKDQL